MREGSLADLVECSCIQAVFRNTWHESLVFNHLVQKPTSFFFPEDKRGGVVFNPAEFLPLGVFVWVRVGVGSVNLLEGDAGRSFTATSVQICIW